MLGACVLRVGTSLPMESGRNWKTTSHHRDLPDGRDGLEIDNRLVNNGNGTDDFGFSALPGGYRDYTMATSAVPARTALVEFVARVTAMLGPDLNVNDPAITGATTIHASGFSVQVSQGCRCAGLY